MSANTPAWSAADYRRDAEAQTAEHNDAMRAEANAARDDGYIDDRPTRQELESAEWAALRDERNREWWD